MDLQALSVHLRSKIHRRRLKELRTEPYTQEEAEAAAGMGQFVAARSVEVPKLLGAAAHAAMGLLLAESNTAALDMTTAGMDGEDEE